MTLEEVLANTAGEAAALRANGRKAQAISLERVVDAVREAAEEYLVFMSEHDAMLRSGRSKDWLRQRFPAWSREGHAKLRAGHREYRTLIVPCAANLVSAREAGRAAARKNAA